jgi:hypothetical protein
MALSREKSTLDKKSLGALIRRLRVEILGIDKRWEMAARLDMSPDIYTNWELGRSFPTAADMLNILQTFPEAGSLFGLDIAPRGTDNSVNSQTATARGVKLVPKHFKPRKLDQ